MFYLITTRWVALSGQPLAGGLLTGKDLNEGAKGVRFATVNDRIKRILHFDEYFPTKIDKTREMFKGFEEITKSMGKKVPQLALA